MRGYLLQQGTKVTELMVRDVMRTVDPDGVFHRTAQNRAIVRRIYYVKYSNDLWHLTISFLLDLYEL